MGGGRRPAGRRPQPAPADGADRPAEGGRGLQRGRRCRAVASCAGGVGATEENGVSAERSPDIDVTAGGVRWRLRVEYRERLLGPQGLRLDEWLRTGQARVVKHGPHRTVYQVTLPGLKFYLKHFRLTDVRSRLRQTVRPAKACIEYDRAVGVASRQVPTITPLGVGVRCDGAGPGDSFLMTHSLDDVTPLDAFIEKTLPSFDPPRLARVRLHLAQELGAFVARMHDAGILHGDFHAANLLVRLEASDKVRLFLIDLHAARLGRPLDWRASRATLVILNRWFSLRAGRSDRLRFWKAYCRCRASLFDGWHRKPLHELACDLERRTWTSNRTFWRHRDRRCLVTNRYYQRVR